MLAGAAEDGSAIAADHHQCTVRYSSQVVSHCWTGSNVHPRLEHVHRTAHTDKHINAQHLLVPHTSTIGGHLHDDLRGLLHQVLQLLPWRAAPLLLQMHLVPPSAGWSPAAAQKQRLPGRSGCWAPSGLHDGCEVLRWLQRQLRAPVALMLNRRPQLRGLSPDAAARLLPAAGRRPQAASRSSARSAAPAVAPQNNCRQPSQHVKQSGMCILTALCSIWTQP